MRSRVKKGYSNAESDRYVHSIFEQLPVTLAKAELDEEIGVRDRWRKEIAGYERATEKLRREIVKLHKQIKTERNAYRTAVREKNSQTMTQAQDRLRQLETRLYLAQGYAQGTDEEDYARWMLDLSQERVDDLLLQYARAVRQFSTRE